MKRLVPEFYAKDIDSIPVSFFKENGIKFIFSDLDNTLDPANVKVPSERVYELIKKFKENNIAFYIISNNSKKRVGTYASKVEVPFLYHSLKPFGFKMKSFMKKNGIKPEEVILIGDQLLTDVKASKRAKIKCCLTEPISKVDQWTTYFNRYIDKKIRNKMKRKNLLNEIKEEK